MPEARDEQGTYVDNRKCGFGRQHGWMGRGSKVAGHSVLLCSDCLLVAGTGRKATDPLGAVFEAERIASEHFGAPIVLAKKRRKAQQTGRTEGSDVR